MKVSVIFACLLLFLGTLCSAHVLHSRFQVDQVEKQIPTANSFSNYLTSPAHWEEHYHGVFRAWMLQYEKEYEYMDEEYQKRYPTFKENFLRVQKHSPAKHSYSIGLTKFADMNAEEFYDLYLLKEPQDCSATSSNPEEFMPLEFFYDDLPQRVDWRKEGIVSHVKNQGQCGSCWTFSTTGAVEAHHAKKFGKVLDLSEQQLVDCAQAFDNHGCSGGLPSHAFEYIMASGGIMQEADYHYTGKDSSSGCHFHKNEVKATVKNSFNITRGDESMLQIAVAHAGPVSIAYTCADDFHLYSGGVYSNDKCPSSPQAVNHAVLAVGYDTLEDGTEYWIVKNSWGPDWGLNGYFHIAKGKNMCGLAECAAYPIV
eukprot:Nk52_evm91s2118 gene=Nk52_evmTU91s2118